jgi:SAM-dependent methyltransferase
VGVKLCAGLEETRTCPKRSQLLRIDTNTESAPMSMQLICPPWLIVRRLGLRPTDRVLEVGPGPGYFSVAVAKKVPQGRLVLFDIQPEMLDMAASRLTAAGFANFETRQGSAELLPFGDASTDTTFLVAVLGEVPDPLRAMKEAARVLRPGGRLSVTESPGDPHFLREERVWALGRDAGLEPERRFGVSRFYTLNFMKV